jgi:8-oxo-dGTP pyrophosphatase MutT (NUDIX family)
VTADRAEPVPVRDAATVLLLRDGTGGIEAWLLTRVRQMAFAAGMSVFPGGRLDSSDADLPLVGADVDDIARRFDCDAAIAGALIGCAARETFEETGVLLTVPAAELREFRADVEAGRVAFGELLRTHGLAVDGAALRPWARWITPPGEARRYDARFFVGALPPGAAAANLTTESSEAEWVPVAVALEQAERGERGLLPPTLVTLAGIRQFGTVADVVAAADTRVIEPVCPTLRWSGDVPAVELPDGSQVAIPRSMFRRGKPR